MGYTYIKVTKKYSKMNTALSLDVKEFKHNPDFDNIKIIHRLIKVLKMRLKESIYIHQKVNKLMNARSEAGKMWMVYAKLLYIIRK